MISSLYLHFRASYRTYGRLKFNRFTVEIPASIHNSRPVS